MDIDKRLEALTMNVELLTRDVHDLQGAVKEVTVGVKKLTAVIADVGGYVKDIANGTARITFEVGTLKERLDRHEKRLDALES